MIHPADLSQRSCTTSPFTSSQSAGKIILRSPSTTGTSPSTSIAATSSTSFALILPLALFFDLTAVLAAGEAAASEGVTRTVQEEKNCDETRTGTESPAQNARGGELETRVKAASLANSGLEVSCR